MYTISVVTLSGEHRPASSYMQKAAPCTAATERLLQFRTVDSEQFKGFWLTVMLERETVAVCHVGDPAGVLHCEGRTPNEPEATQRREKDSEH